MAQLALLEKEATLAVLTRSTMTQNDYNRCARRIAEALQLEPDESVLIKLDTRLFTPLIPPLQSAIRAAGAHISGVILAEETDSSSQLELDSMRKLFNNADVFIWLPELHQGSRPALAQALNEWLDAKRGRAVHFHWNSGSYPLGLNELPSQDLIDGVYLAALDVSPESLDRQHRHAMTLLRSGQIHVTTPEGTDIRFDCGDRSFCSQIGDATRKRM